MKQFIASLLIICAVNAFGQGWTISNTDPLSGGSVRVYGGAGQGNTGATNSCFAAIVPPAGKTPVVEAIWAQCDLIASNGNPYYAWGNVVISTPTNVAIEVGSALTEWTDFVLSNPTAVTNDLGANTMASNTVLLAYNKSLGKVTRCEPGTAWATGTANAFTNIALNHSVTLSSGDLIYIMGYKASFPTWVGVLNDPAGVSGTNVVARQVTPDGIIRGPIYGQPGKPLLIEVRGNSATASKLVASGRFE